MAAVSLLCNILSTKILSIMCKINEKTKLYLEHWFMSCPTVLKNCIPNWNIMTYEQKLETYKNPSKEFIKADKQFLKESEKYNY